MERVVAVAADPSLAGMLSLVLGEPGKFLAILEPPRLQRPDANSEVVERANIVRLASPSTVLLLALEHDEKDRMAVACERLAACTELDTAADLVRYLEGEGHIDRWERDPRRCNPYIAQLLHGVTLPDALLPIIEQAGSHAGHPIANGIVCIEPGLSISAVTAANYAWAMRYSFRELRPVTDLTRDAVEGMLERIDLALAESASEATVAALISEFKRRMSAAIDSAAEWPEGVPLCFFTRAAPYGLLFPKNPVCHVLELQAGLNTACSVGWSEFEASQSKRPGHVAVFVDPLWADITSETEEILDHIQSELLWTERVIGSSATCERFRLYANHFPYELLYVSSHGKAPKYRWCRYQFTTADGLQHEIETNEFEYFSSDGEEVVVTAKTYPLAVDGISWKDKAGLSAIRGGRVFQEFLGSDPRPRVPVEFRWIKNRRVEGIALQDGVFFGPLYRLAAMGHPVVVLNCCSMWTSLGIQVMHARARACIATLWSVRDDAAVAYGVTFCKAVMSFSVITAARQASGAVADDRSATAYVCVTWPHVGLPACDGGVRVPVTDVLSQRLERHFWGMLETLPRSGAPKEVVLVLEFLATRLKELMDSERGVREGGQDPLPRISAALREVRGRTKGL